MNDENLINSFAEGFAKVAEAAGFTGDAVRDLMLLSVDLAQHAKNPDAFAEGFNSVIGARA